MAHHKLGGEDAAWLHMEDATNPMVVNGLLELAAPLATAQVIGLLAEHVAPIPRFRSRVVEPRGGVGTTRWELDPDFDLDRHVVHVELGDDAGEDELRAFLGRTVSTLLDRDRPLWKVFVIDRPGAGSTLLYRVHHAIADGFALLGILLSLCDAAPKTPDPPAPRATARRAPRAFDHALALARVTTLPADPRTALKGLLTTEKRVAWCEPMALGEIKAIAHVRGATVNDVLVAVVTGALRRYLLRAGGSGSAVEVRAMVPVNLRSPGEALTLDNRFGLVVLALPLGVADPGARLDEVKRRMDRLKASPEALVTHGILRVMGHVPRRVEDFGVRFFGKKASLVLTNVAGPREPLKIGGVPISRLMFWVPQSGRMGLGISIFSYGG